MLPVGAVRSRRHRQGGSRQVPTKHGTVKASRNGTRYAARGTGQGITARHRQSNGTRYRQGCRKWSRLPEMVKAATLGGTDTGADNIRPECQEVQAVKLSRLLVRFRPSRFFRLPEASGSRFTVQGFWLSAAFQLSRF